MIAIAVSGLVMGLALGYRFKVFVLIPVIMITMIAAVIASIASVASLDRLFFMFLWFTSAVQFGYFGISTLPVVMARRVWAPRVPKVEA